VKTGIAFDHEAVFAEEFSMALDMDVAKSGWPMERWYWSGRQRPETAKDWWDANGPALVKRFIDWYEDHDDVSVWITPDLRPAIELELEVNFGKIPVKMAIDAVFQMGSALVVVDFKTSAKAPESFRQLGIYASGIEIMWNIRPKYGAYFLPKEEPPFQRPVDLSAPQYSIRYLSREFQLAEGVIEGESFLANPGRSCGRCGVAHACLAYGGDQARKFDPAHPAFGRSALAP